MAAAIIRITDDDARFFGLKGLMLKIHSPSEITLGGRSYTKKIQQTRGFQTMKKAVATTKGFEVMRMIRRSHCLTCKPHVKDEVRFANKLFDVYNFNA